MPVLPLELGRRLTDLSAGFAENEQFLQRFEREARTISSLNHPHICTLFDVGSVGHDGEDGGRAARGPADGPSALHYLVMELIEGVSLADRLKKGPLPLHDVLKYGRQIASALDAAHRQGITHRDLKPGNIMLTKSGAKLLDFGSERSGDVTIERPHVQLVAALRFPRPIS